MVLAACVSPSPGPGPTGATPSTVPSSSTGEEEEGGQSGEDSGSCDQTITVGEPDDVLAGPYGAFTARDLQDLSDGTFETLLSWSEDGATTPLLLELVWDGEIRVVDPLLEYCDHRIEIDGSYTATTADGRLAEAGETVLVGRQAEIAGFAVVWEEGTLGGTLVFPEGSATLAFRTTIDAAGARGDILTAGGAEVATFGP